MGKIQNFGGNLEFQPQAVYRPGTVGELLEILNRHRGQEIRAVGSLHSWSFAPETSGILLELGNLDSIEISRDDQGISVSVGAGCQLKTLIKHLAAQGLTLPSLGLIDEQTVAGATATGTHGSGKNSLSHYVESVSIAHYDEPSGEARIAVVNSGQDLKAARCSLGLMGIIVSLKFRCRSRYNIEEHGRAHDSLGSVLAMESDYPQQQFYLMPWSWRYFAHHRVESKSATSRLAPLYRAYCFFVIDVGLHVVIFGLAKLWRRGWPIRFFYKRLLPVAIIRNWKVVGDSSANLTMQHELFRHIEIEVFVQRAQLDEALRFLIDMISIFGGQDYQHQQSTEALLEKVGRQNDLLQHRGKYVHHYPICIRRILSDATLISMASPGDPPDEDWYSISLISYQWPHDRAGFFAFADFVGATFARLFGARCHWGKYNPLDRELTESLYPMIDEFRNTVRRFDPDGVFKNDWFRQFF
jgi:FAD/FMN-containing dehydrogenase